MRADVALPRPKACADRSSPGDGSQPSGCGLGRSFSRRERQRRLPGRLRPRRNAMPTPVARPLPSSARGARPIARGTCTTRSSMAWPSTGATWSWARSGSWPQSTEDSVRRSPRRARGPHEEAFRQLKTSFSGPTASSRTRSIRDLTKRGDGASGLRSTNGAPGLSSLGSGERPGRTMPASCQQRQPDPETVSAEPLREAGAGSDSSGFLTPMDGSQPSGCGLGRSFSRRERQRRLPGRLRPRRNAMPTPVARPLPSSARGARPIARGTCTTRSSMAWPSTGATWSWARSGAGRRAPKTAFDEALDGRVARTKRPFAS